MRGSGGSFMQFPLWTGFAMPGEEPSLYTSDYFAYLIGPGANGAPGNLAAAGSNGSTAQSQLIIEGDSQFEWWCTTFSATLNGASEPNLDNIQVPVTLQIKDGGAGRDLFYQPTPISQIAGPGRQPYWVPDRRIFLSKSTVNFFWANLDSTAWNGVSVTLHGRKIFDIT